MRRFTHPLTIFEIPEGAKSLTGVPKIFVGDGKENEMIHQIVNSNV